MVDVADYIESGHDPKLALDDDGWVKSDGDVGYPCRRLSTSCSELHAKGRDHIWAYYTRNLVRPITLARNKVDVIVGNPPWINYNQTKDVLRDELVNQSRNEYGIWARRTVRYAAKCRINVLFKVRRPISSRWRVDWDW